MRGTQQNCAKLYIYYIHIHTHKLYLYGITADNQVKAGGAGAIDVIVNAMKTHTNNADVCEHGCGALNNIAANGTYIISTRIKTQINDTFLELQLTTK